MSHLRRTRLALLVGIAFVLAMAAGCTGTDQAQPNKPDGSAGSESPASGSRLAPGLYELENGIAQAVGTLEWSDLEGGFWLVTGGTEAEGDLGTTVAVIANGADFETDLKPLKGKQVVVTGTMLDGASIRMAGPEIEMQSIEEMSDTPGPAE